LTVTGFAYLDASAFVKLVAAEPESAALEAELRSWPYAVASDLLEIEAKRFAERYGGQAPLLVEAALRRVMLIPIRPEIRRLAAAVRPVELRTLDAIHLTTALVLGSRVAAFFTYDSRLGAAARSSGLEVCAPA
jgi:predicted nucleic acid-binding protein